MRCKRLAQVLITVVLCIGILFSSVSFAADFAFETQFDYTSANPAWLTDLVLKEDMTSASGLVQRTELYADSVSDYTETPDSFQRKVDNYCQLYTLSPDSAKAGYLFVLDLMGSNAGLFAGDASDEAVQDYLTGIGIVYPGQTTEEEQVIAKALYTACITGAFSSSQNALSGATLEEALATFASSMTGLSKQALSQWTPSGSILTLDEYVLAASRLSLWSSGYPVSVNTPENEVYRLVAVMTVKSMGYTIDSGASFEEVRIKYLAALLGKAFEVTPDTQKLQEAVDSDTVSYYILQVMGAEAGLSIRAQSVSYEKAFWLVAEHTNRFDLEQGEFYADIYNYTAYLQYKRSSIWVYPTAYSSGAVGYTVQISVNGTTVRNSYYTQIAVDPSKEVQQLVFTVRAVGAYQSYECKYTVELHQGQTVSENKEQITSEGQTELHIPDSDSVVKDILTALDVDKSILDAINSFATVIPQTVKDAISFIAPTFDGNVSSPSGGIGSTGTVSEQGDTAIINRTQSDDYYIQLLDKMGAYVNSGISGLYGVDVLQQMKQGTKLKELISFD